MNKFLVLILLTMSLSKTLFANEINDFIITLDRYYWQDSLINNQVSTYPDGIVKVDYSLSEDGVVIRNEYFSNGQLKIQARVIQKFTVDTISYEDLLTGNITYEVKSGFVDIPHGEYKEFLESYSKKGDLKSHGYFDMGVQVGEWVLSKNPSLVEIRVNFDNSGKLNGLFREYYRRYSDKELKVRVQGRYSTLNINRLVRNSKSGDYEENTYEKTMKVGKWKYYDYDGKLLEVVKYKWKGRKG